MLNRNLLTNNGYTLIEMLVTLVILSILAGAALPYAEKTIQRSKEIELRQALREIRSAIDQFHEDWKSGVISPLSEGVSDDGYPLSLDVLVNGVEIGDVEGNKRYYIRRIPRDPMFTGTAGSKKQWRLRSYQDEPDSITWGGHDVYDVSSRSVEKGIDGTNYHDW